MNDTPRFAHLQYAVLHELEISISEYWYLDMVYQLSRQGWCTKRLDNIAIDMRMTRQGVIKMRDRLIQRGLIIKEGANNVRTSEKVNKVYIFDETQRKSILSYKKSKLSYKKSILSYKKSKQSFPKNNNRITIEYNNDKKMDKDNNKLNGPGYAKYVEMKKKFGYA